MRVGNRGLGEVVKTLIFRPFSGVFLYLRGGRKRAGENFGGAQNSKKGLRWGGSGRGKWGDNHTATHPFIPSGGGEQ
jgi:hypothetical protein